MDISKGSSKREVYSNSGLPLEIRKTSNKQSNLTPKGTRKTRPNKMQSEQKEVSNKDQSGDKLNRDRKV